MFVLAGESGNRLCRVVPQGDAARVTARSFTQVTRSPEETESLGRRLAAACRPGAVVALHGDLASGKTCLARGMASQAAPGATIHSPTFTLINEYGHPPGLYHLDLYRLENIAEVHGLGLEDLMGQNDALFVVEWAERAQGLLPEQRVNVYLEHAGGDERRIRIEDNGGLVAGLPDF